MRLYHTLSANSDALVNEGMNLALKEDLEKRGVKFAPAVNKRLAEGKDILCV